MLAPVLKERGGPEPDRPSDESCVRKEERSHMPVKGAWRFSRCDGHPIDTCCGVVCVFAPAVNPPSRFRAAEI